VTKFRETLGFLLLLILGLAPRLAFVTRFPTIAFSDFNTIVAFGQHLHDHGIFTNGWFWEYFNPGLPLVLAALFGIFPGDPGSVARVATALACGLLPILPFLIWRGVLPFWLRLLTGASLALWPGQILFTGVVAQDNWVLLPAVALGALAVRFLLAGDRPRPVIAGLLLAAGVAMRQEMLIVLFPLFLAAAGVTLRGGWWRWFVAGFAAGLPLLALVAYRGVATGRYTLSTEHAGLAVLGAYIPGASANAWTDPYPYIASVRPDLLHDRQALLTQASMLAVREALRRPGFQSARILSAMCTFSVQGEALSLYWSLGAPEVLPLADREPGEALDARVGQPLRYEMAAIQGLFLAALLVGIRRRNVAILVLASAVLLKFAIHAAIAAQGRYFYAATALEILAIAVAAYEVWTAPPAKVGQASACLPPASRRALLALALGVGMVFALGLLLVRLPLEVYVRTHDTDQQRTYRFPLAVADHGAELDCVMNRGLLVTLDVPRESTQSAAIRTMKGDPPWGDAATAVCELSGTGKPRPLTLQVMDPYAPGGFPDRMLQRVEIDGVEVYSHDIAKEPGSGWANLPLGDVGEGTKRKVVIEVKAIRPDPGPGWGNAAVTTFQLSRN
jgi:hypothetical protein